MRRTVLLPLLLFIAGLAVLGAGCRGSEDTGLTGTTAAAAGSTAATGERLKVVTTVAPITNLVAGVAGGLADVEGVVPEGANSHEFEPAPSVAKVLSGADVIFINGLHLEEPTKELAEANLKDGAEIVELGNGTISENEYLYDFSFPESEGNPNPHLWMNPIYAKNYAEIAMETLSERDPANADGYKANYEKLAAQIDAFDKALREATATLPADKRKLLTYHDSYAYFAREYGWDVVGAIQPADFSEPSPKEVADLITQIRDEKIPAVFGSEVFPSPVTEQIAKESGATYIDALRDDDLPEKPGDENHSYLHLVQFDYSTIVEALGGDPSAVVAAITNNLTGDQATYPQ